MKKLKLCTGTTKGTHFCDCPWIVSTCTDIYTCSDLTATLIGAQNMVSMQPVNIKLCQLITPPHPLWPWIIKFCVGFYLHVSHHEMGSGHGVVLVKNNLLRGFWNSVNQNCAICLAYWYRFLLSHVCEWSSSIALSVCRIGGKCRDPIHYLHQYLPCFSDVLNNLDK